jgi:gliding motility-associated-like protein
MNVSTWNTIDQYSTVPASYTLPASFPKQNCLCILAVEKGPNPLGYQDSSYSNIICPYEINDLYIPNAFTPNADGKNEAFKPNAPNLNPATSMLIIYNRWGSVVFKGNTLLGWDGSDTQTAVCPAGVYAYTLDAVSLNGSRKLIQGTVHLIR